MNKTQKAILALIVANIIWGAAAPIFKWSLVGIGPFTLAFSRFFLACLILLPFCYKNLSLRVKDIFPILVLSIIGINVNIAFFFLGLTMSSSINAPVISSSAPIFLILASFLFLKEKIKRKKVIGTVVSLIGILCIILQPVMEKGLDGSVTGNVFFILATLGSVIHVLVLRKLAKKVNVFTLTFWSFLITSIVFFPLMLPELRTSFVNYLNIRALFGILYGAIFASTIAYTLVAYGERKIPANEVGVFIYIGPVIAIIVAYFLLHETLNPIFILGTVFVFLGIFVAEGRLHYHPLHLLLRASQGLKSII